MKNFHALMTLIVLFITLTLTSCVKETAEIIPTEIKKEAVLVGWFKTSNIFGECDPGMGFCGSIWETITPNHHESTGTAKVRNGQIELTLTENNLPEELKEMLTRDRIFPVEKDYELSEDFVKNVYKNAGLDAPADPITIAAGVYKVTEVVTEQSPTGALLFIKITIKIGPVTITIEW